MIYYDSRYATGTVFQAYDARKQNYPVTVFRNSSDIASEFYYYTWVERDRIDIISERYLGKPEYWWKIMDINPEILDPFEIPVGTVLRIPTNAF